MKNYLLSDGWELDPTSKSGYTGQPNLFKKNRHNEHVIKGHDVTYYKLELEDSFVTIYRKDNSSYNYGDFEIVFKGKVENLDFLKALLKAV